jgi:hypothetical protein
MKAARVVRERSSRLTQGRVACALILDRDLTGEEIERFRGLHADEEPRPERFTLEERVVRYECDSADEPKWRLAFEIFLAKTFRTTPVPPAGPPRPTADTRSRAGLRKLHLG